MEGSYVYIVFCLIVLLESYSEARSIHGLEFASDVIKENSLMNGHLIQLNNSYNTESRQPNREIWRPSTGSREEFLRYHGYTRERWTDIIKNLQLIDEIQHGDGPSLQDQHHGRLPTRVEEGCLWYTEEQVSEMLDQVREAPASLTSSSASTPEPSGSSEGSAEGRVDERGCDCEEEQGSGSVAREAHERRVAVGSRVHRRHKRKVENMERRPDRKWQNPIVYKFDGTHTEQEKNVIREAVMHWENKTCLKFFELSRNAIITRQHLLFTKESYGCYSFVGKISEVPQQINLAAPCLTQIGIPIHEVGHALGLWHEQQRGDRDRWVRVIRDNIGYYSSQFWRRDTVSHGVPYDFGSVMHYASTAGSLTRDRTMEALDPLYTASMGQRVQLSYLDAKIINLEYCGSDCAGRDTPPCQRGGYQDPDNCHRCICPDGFGGDLCQQPASAVNAGCGGRIILGDERVHIESPGYTGRRYYDDFTECSWVIQAPEDHNITLTFDETFAVYVKDSITCFHWIEIKYTDDFEYPGPRFCGYSTPVPQQITSETNEMVVIFQSNFATDHKRTRLGFRASLEAVRPEWLEGPETTTEALTSSTTTENYDGGWTAWSDDCTRHECTCGGCSVQTRHRLCGETPCRGDLAAMETRPCDRLCTKRDEFLQYTGQFIRAPCPVCCPGFEINNGKCQPMFL